MAERLEILPVADRIQEKGLPRDALPGSLAHYALHRTVVLVQNQRSEVLLAAPAPSDLQKGPYYRADHIPKEAVCADAEVPVGVLFTAGGNLGAVGLPTRFKHGADGGFRV